MQASSDRIVVLGTGGTIAGTAARPGDHLGYRAGQLGVQQLLAGLPSLASLQVVSEQVAQIDSKDLGFDTWQVLAARCAHWLQQPDVRGVVITHGTDTVEETAYLLHRVLAPDKPIVLTCAMRPATAVAPDGPQNIIDAFAVASTPGARGAVLVCAGVVHGAADVRKVHPYRLDPFTSGDAGPIGYVEDGKLRQVRDWPVAPAPGDLLRKIAGSRSWPRVEIVLSHAGAGGRLVQALVADGVQGIVVAGTGNASVHQALEDALLEAAAKGVRVVRSTRCMDGRVIAQAQDRLPAHPLAPVKARIDLLLELMA
ncbi:MAG: L-asparaginase [uncultured Ramlibacter sp.]|uniref:L-asparaginase n=1 Tax=uncultured Ramlibacter sp. TaxID=260755 RepID=A0A6J4PY65_9BURK|nr:MAG: L-asparaginase [uncultured Ramlibacter sp.]